MPGSVTDPAAKQKKSRKKKTRTREISSPSSSSSSSSSESSPEPSRNSKKRKTKTQNFQATNGPVVEASITSPTDATRTTIVKSTSRPITEEQAEEAFTTYYLRQITSEFAQDLDKLRTARDFKDSSSVAVLVEGLKQGRSCFAKDERLDIGRAIVAREQDT